MKPRRAIPRWIFAVLASVIVFFAALTFLSVGQTGNSRIEELPELTLEDIDGNQVSLHDLRGNVILVNNFATWCGPCRTEMPELQAFYEQNKDHGFIIVAIEAGQPAPEVKNFVKEYGVTFPVLLDPQQLALGAFNMYALPNSILVDREGKIRRTWIGAIDQSVLEAGIMPLIREE